MDTNIFQDNKYTKLYYRIIAKHGRQEKPGDDNYYERHHIIPRSMGGNDEQQNLIYVRVRVHFLLHVLLAKAVQSQYRKRACWCVICFSANNEKQLVRRKLKSRFVQTVREEHNANLKTLKWYNNGQETIRLFPEEQVPTGFVNGRLKLPSRAGVKYITDGVQTKRIKADQPLPDGWVYGQKPERLNQISEQGKNHKMGSGTGRVWINDGTVNKYIYLADGITEGWVKGRLKTGNFDPSKMRTKSAGTTGKSWKVKPSDHDAQFPA